MNLDDLDVHKLMNRLAVIERSDIGERLDYIEKQLKYFVYAATEMKDKFAHGIAVKLDNNSINIAKSFNEKMQECVKLIHTEAMAIREIRKEIEQERRLQHEMLAKESVIGTLQFMAKQLKLLTEQVNKIREDGINKELHLSLSMDGHKMVKAEPERKALQELPINSNASIQRLFTTLTAREGKLLAHRFGLLGETAKTYLEIGNIVQLSSSRVGTLIHRALRKCRHHTRKVYTDNLPNSKFKLAIMEA